MNVIVFNFTFYFFITTNKIISKLYGIKLLIVFIFDSNSNIK
jgi:hypothetical protein